MSSETVSDRTDISAKIKEAEICQSMGFYDEALKIYEKLLGGDLGLDESQVEKIKEKIQNVKKEIEDKKSEEHKKVSSQDLLLIRKSVRGQGSIPEMLQGAASLKEIGLKEEAAKEYEKVFEFDLSKYDFSSAKVISEYASCLFGVHPIQEVAKKTRSAMHKANPPNKEKARILAWLGMEMQRRDQVDMALEHYKAAAKFDPENEKIKNKINAAIANVSSTTRYDYLLTNKIITTEQLKRAHDIAKGQNKSVEHVLTDHFKIKKEEVGKSLSHFFDCPFVAFDPEYSVPYELISKLKKSFLLYYSWVPLRWSKDSVDILIDDPRDLRKTDHIKALMATQKIQYSVGFREDIQKFIEHFFDRKHTESDREMLENIDSLIPDITFEEAEEEEEEYESLDESSSQVVRFVDQVLITAYRDRASDIHIEPSPVTAKTMIRFRVDGVCHEYLQIPNSMVRGIISRLKIMANLDIAERRLPQDGKIKLKRKGIPPFELRLSTMPTAGGFEDAVLRVLAKAGAMKLDDMGLLDRNFKTLKKIISQPYGLVLVVGPTGSGKTTTLHAALGYLNRPDIKIWTAEDPVEITQKGLRQVEVNSKIGLNFARVMRGFLRLDPDVIMIGEMRDRETASIGVEASLTGHLVFSTLHTISAPETITRLIDMEINALNFSDAFLGVLAQRLVRRLCPDCKKAYTPSQEEFREIVMDYGEEAFKKTGITYSEKLELFKTEGCENCSDTGYRGRMGIHELMEGTKKIKRLIKKKASSEELFDLASAEGMTTLKQDGIRKVFLGYTDIKELRRVVID